jgi:putative FmdB family regulatory protein
MPIYAYRCNSCGFEKDHLQKLRDPVLSTCPKCGKAAYAKQVTAAGFQLKGTGWYATDFKGDGTSKVAAPKTASAPHCQGCAGADVCAGS